ncbi:hypothetical protein E8D34_02095 [Nocardioides sp. GY 10113]|uniref:hypothetical protein n=1 Tax=Nocardioides sp. GY 10113 TaxID=2569761 RepID=UPI0010A7C155|nr:hypothetical protein [Nocardioides sp. GY 10113]TIC89300.1 hypothetical protein E8D34_02095 [Nocardioides sp. GY 10113]
MSTAPPPPPGYEPPPGGYGGPPAGGWDLGAALSYTWAKFQDNMGQLVLATIGVWVAVAIVGIASTGLLVALADAGTPWLLRSLLQAALYGAVFVVAQLIAAALIRGSLSITEGRDFFAVDAFKFAQVGPVLVTALLVGAATAVGYVFCVLPGIAIAFLTMYSLYFVVDEDLPPVEAITASFNLVKDNLGNALLWWLVGGLIAVAGFVLCFVGALVTIPFVLIGTAYTYKVLTRQPVAD